LAGNYSHWPIAANLPSTTYDRALIMGPYHDLDPGVTTSPTMRINYTVWGTAPNRRWILSFYKVPLFSGVCNPLIENTHQIVLYEGLGVVEVMINSKQQCPTWNQGRAIVGMQNYARTSGIMAPGRTATSPPWGTVNMNESWRFVPASGPTLYKKVELFTLGGVLVSTGDTVSIGNNTFAVTFPNVCPSSSNTQYVIRTEYSHFNNPGVVSVGTDTLRVTYNGGLSANTAVTNIQCNGQANGSIVLNNTVGGTPPYQYSINGGTTFQASNTFSNLPAGTYNVRIKDNTVCTRDTIVNITQPAVISAQTNKTDATCGTPGSITVTTTTGGNPPYSYSINGTTFQPSNVFNVPSGAYTVTIKDANNCTITSNVNVGLVDDLTLQVRSDTTICAGGSVRLTTTSSATSYSWSPATGLDDPYSASPLASPLVPTDYVVTATLGQCTKTATVHINAVQAVFVSAGPDVSIVSGDKAQLNGTATNATSYLWTPSTGLNLTMIPNPVAKPATTTLYTLTVSNDEGCIASDDVLVTVVPYCIKVKNAFSPNGDGINDVWQIYDQFDCLKNISLGVFNRYGSKVFESQDYRNNWDGRYKGKPVPDGTYYGVILFTLVSGKTLTIKTDLTIIR
jgi:gliding motility-associated-like protein